MNIKQLLSFKSLYPIRNKRENYGRNFQITGLFSVILTSILTSYNNHGIYWLAGMVIGFIFITYGWVIIYLSKKKNGTTDDLNGFFPFLIIIYIISLLLLSLAILRQFVF